MAGRSPGGVCPPDRRSRLTRNGGILHYVLRKLAA
jgi:hypothetical protein